jgi:phosphoribosylformylglycinamidine synthase
MNVMLDEITEKDIIRILFSENPGLIIQVKNKSTISDLEKKGIKSICIGNPIDERKIYLSKNGEKYFFDIDLLRDIWYKTSYLLDRKQSGEKKSLERYKNYKSQKLNFIFPKNFTGKSSQYSIDLNRRKPSSIKAAIIREKGVNGDREMAWSMYLAGLDVKDVHMTDLVSGRETLEDVNLIVFVGGFSNSDVLGSAKGWAGAFLYNEKARKTLDKFYARKDTLSLGVCNGCQLVIELGLITPDHKEKPQMLHNDSHKFESAFLTVDIPKNDSVMLKTLSGSRLGIWVAHGEGKFHLPYEENKYNVTLKYSHSGYPGNPNGSDYNVAGICSSDGRHLAMMPHLERAMHPWNWAHYPGNRKSDEITPWVEAFVNAREWIRKV